MPAAAFLNVPGDTKPGHPPGYQAAYHSLLCPEMSKGDEGITSPKKPEEFG